MKPRFLLLLSCAMTWLLTPDVFSQSTVEDNLSSKQSPISDAQITATELKRVAQEKVHKNESEFQQLKLVDSVGWLKILAIKKPDESMERLERERMQRKIASLSEFCTESHFEKLAEVDSIKMTIDEKAFCKERIRLSNPLLR